LTCEVDIWSVVQVTVAEVAVTPLEATALITGIDTVAPVPGRSSRAGAAHGAEPAADEQVTTDAVAAVLSHKSIST
jgi:hypothetical protein